MMRKDTEALTVPPPVEVKPALAHLASTTRAATGTGAPISTVLFRSVGKSGSISLPIGDRGEGGSLPASEVRLLDARLCVTVRPATLWAWAPFPQ